MLVLGGSVAAHAAPQQQVDSAQVSVGVGQVELSNEQGSFEIDTSTANGVAKVQVVDQGAGISITSTITGPANAQVSYPVEIPAGVNATTVTNYDGVKSVVLATQAGDLAGGIAPLSAVDANGTAVPTSLHADGETVVQQIDGDMAAVAYPVQVRAAASTVWYKRAWVGTASKGYIV